MSQVAKVKSVPLTKKKTASNLVKKTPSHSQKSGSGIVKARTFYNSSSSKKKKQHRKKGDANEENLVNTKDSVTENSSHNTSTNTNKIKKRTLANFYQKQTHANVSYYTTKKSIKEQLGYVLRKYPPQKLASSWGHLNRQVQPRYPPSSLKSKPNNNNNNKRKLPDWTATVPDITGFQVSQEAMDVIWLTTCKTVDNILTKASEIATRSKAQTVTDVHICQAYQDLCKMRDGGE